MSKKSQELVLRWSDIDANFHLRHSVYYDFGAQLRTDVLDEIGLNMMYFQKERIGPILFREEAVFRKEIRYGDKIMLDVEISKARRDYSRWSIRHRFYKAEDNTTCTILTVDGAWMDTKARKLCVPPIFIQDAFNLLEKAEDFEYLD